MADVKLDTSEIRELERIFGTIAPKELQKSMRRALSRTRTGARTETSKKVREIYNIQARRLKRDVVLTRPDYRRFAFRVIGRPKPIGLANFRGKSGPPRWRPSMPGVSVAVENGKRKLIKHAFIRAGLHGNTQVFTRYRDDGSKSGRLPIRSLKGPSASDMMLGAEVEEMLAERAVDRFNTELSRNLKHLLGR